MGYSLPAILKMIPFTKRLTPLLFERKKELAGGQILDRCYSNQKAEQPYPFPGKSHTLLGNSHQYTSNHYGACTQDVDELSVG